MSTFELRSIAFRIGRGIRWFLTGTVLYWLWKGAWWAGPLMLTGLVVANELRTLMDDRQEDELAAMKRDIFRASLSR